MGRKQVHGQLIGICLLPESYIPHCFNASHLNKGQIIGTILIPVEGTTCIVLRQSIKDILDAPKDFCFLNCAGWPIDKSNEEKILITECLSSSVVTIQQKHGSFFRVGVKLLNGTMLGFIFLNFTQEISYVRNQITSDLDDQFEDDESFEFIDNNLWPVRKKQENNLSLWHLIKDNCIIIKKKQLKKSTEHKDIKSEKRFKSSRPSIDITKKEDELNSYSILISYVHREATAYAKKLKEALKKMGFKKIFLDVDDIPAGDDWQDVISVAVNECSLFVPLVTSGYGETRWTNREAKLADDRKKNIIPISFLDKWPPDQLAIQFLSLQYIPWKTLDEINGGSFSGHSDSEWNQKSIQRVANEIRKWCFTPDVSTPDSASLLYDKPYSSLNFTLELTERQRKKINVAAEKIFIVISAHSKQQKFVEENISKMLKLCGYFVWSSICMCDCDENTFSPIEDSQPLHSSISESSPSVSMVHSSSTVKSLKSEFKEKVKAAKLVILIFSEDYINSRICRQQAFYCEQRKKAIVIKYGDFQIDSRMLNLYAEREMIDKENWDCLKYKIQDKLNFDSETSYWNGVNLWVSKLRTAINTDMAVYIIGGSDKISKGAEEFCRALGNELAKVKNLNLVTGGRGAGDIVGRNFCEEQEIMNKGQPRKVYHIIPNVDSSDNSSDCIFEALAYGKTLYYGMSVSNRDDIVAATFKLCILIAGGEKSTCLAEKFLFHESTVIPVLCNHSAIKNKQQLKESLSQVPNNVDESDWQRLLNKHITPEERAKTVKRIICAILNLNY